MFACDSKSDLEVDNTIEQTFSNYVEYWSEGDFDSVMTFDTSKTITVTKPVQDPPVSLVDVIVMR